MTLYEDEIDLRPYIAAIFKAWWIIILLVVVAVLSTMFFASRTPSTYVAESSILIARSRIQLSLSDEFPTVSDPLDRRSNIDTMLSLSNGSGVAQEAAANLQKKYPNKKISVLQLLGQVEVTNKGNLLVVTAESEDPQFAADLANEWSSAAVRTINTAFMEEQPLAEVQTQRAAAEQEYLTRQASLEDFISTSPVSLLEQQIKNTETLLLSQASDTNYQISYYVQRKQAMESVASQAEALKKQMQAGNETAAAELGDFLMLLNTRAQAFGLRLPSSLETQRHESSSTSLGDTTLPSDSSVSTSLSSLGSNYLYLNIDANEIIGVDFSPAQAVQDLEIIQTIALEEAEQATKTLAEMSELSNSDTGNEALQETASRLQSLRSELEAVRARDLQLTTQRDIAWEALQAITRKETEIKQGSSTTQYVNLAATAAIPEVPASREILQKSLVAAVVAVLFGAVAVIAGVWLRAAKPTKQQTEITPVSESTD